MRDPSATPILVNRHDDYKLRQFLAARTAGDEVSARRWWEQLVQDNFDRVVAWVGLESRGRLSAAEQEDAVSRALLKLLNNMIRTFHGTSMGEWVLATKTLVRGACIDTQRREERVSSRRATLDPDDERVELEESPEDEDDGRLVEFLDWAIPQLTPKRRAVIEADRLGLPCEQIQRQHDMTRDGVYQNRSRALRDLDKLRGEFFS